jgi:hypothetical protein
MPLQPLRLSMCGSHQAFSRMCKYEKPNSVVGKTRNGKPQILEIQGWHGIARHTLIPPIFASESRLGICVYMQLPIPNEHYWFQNLHQDALGPDVCMQKNKSVLKMLSEI